MFGRGFLFVCVRFCFRFSILSFQGSFNSFLYFCFIIKQIKMAHKIDDTEIQLIDECLAYIYGYPAPRDLESFIY